MSDHRRIGSQLAPHVGPMPDGPGDVARLARRLWHEGRGAYITAYDLDGLSDRTRRELIDLCTGKYGARREARQ
ncbi:hypothetical protein [Parvibaculum sp. MBR-TMA-1.3b-4.2]|jgi:hypothetical protein